jgi:hypothetical protein
MKILTSRAGSLSQMPTLKQLIAVFLLAASVAGCMAADVVYVTARGLHSPGPNDNGTYNDNGFGNDSTAASTAPGVPARNGSRYCSLSFTNSTPESGKYAEQSPLNLAFPSISADSLSARSSRRALNFSKVS